LPLPPPPASTLPPPPPPPPTHASISLPPSVAPPAVTLDLLPQTVRMPLPQVTETRLPPAERPRPEPTYAVTPAQPVFQFSPQPQPLPQPLQTQPPQPAPLTSRPDVVSFAAEPGSTAVRATSIQNTPAHSYTVDARQPSTTSPPPEPVYAVTPSQPVILFWSKPQPPEAPPPRPREVTASFAAEPHSPNIQAVAIPTFQAPSPYPNSQVERTWFAGEPR
jgi:hypothetical protein